MGAKLVLHRKNIPFKEINQLSIFLYLFVFL
jgi:hypothetical protein